MSKILLPFNKYKKSSIDLVEKSFDPKLIGEWISTTDRENIFLSAYIQEKFKDILHTIPFVNFQIIYDIDLKKTILVLGDSVTLKLNFFGKDSFGTYNKKYRETDKRFTYYPISIAELNATKDGLDHHGISALYDKQSNKVEIFDSIGSDFKYFKKTFKDLFNQIYGSEVKIVYIVDRCVVFGKLEYEKCNPEHYIYRSEGFCSIWRFWFLELRLANPRISKEKLIEKALKILKKDNKVCELLRGYAQFIEQFLSKYSLERTSSNLIIKPKKNLSLTKKDYSYLYTFLGAIFGSILAAKYLKKLRKN
jgi:hypothetical protein